MRSFYTISAIAHLNGVHLYGKEMFVSSSKYAQVQLPKEPDVSCDSEWIFFRKVIPCNFYKFLNSMFHTVQPSGLTQDYSQSALHRFKVIDIE